VKKSPG